MLVFSALDPTPFRSIKLGTKDINCVSCGTSSHIDKIKNVQDVDYVQFCGGQVPNWEQLGLLEGDIGARISAKV
jgi:adenylyltransferase/sulfurtransferase